VRDDRRQATTDTLIIFLSFKGQNDIMSQKNKMQMPQSSAGLMRYFDQSKESIKIKPEYVVIFSVVIIALEVIFRFMM